MLPRDWQYQTVRDTVAFLEVGASVNSEDRPMRDGEIGVLKVSAVSYGTFDPTAYKTVLPEERDRLSINPKRDTVIVSRANTSALVGASAYVDRDYPHLFLPDKLWQLTTKEVYSAKWLSYVLILPEIRTAISDRATGTSASMKNISQNSFLSVKIPVPPLAEQRKIAAILGTWDAAIASVEQLIAALQARKQGLMQRLLTGAVRFPEFANATNEDGEVISWDMLPFSDFAERNSQKFDPRQAEEIRHCIELEHIESGTGRLLGYSTVGDQASIKTCFDAGQVLFGKLRPYLRKYTQPNFDGVCSSEIWVLSGKDQRCSNDYLFYLVQSDQFISVANASYGTKMPRADWGYLADTLFPLPTTLEEQARIASLFRCSDEMIDQLSNYRELLNQQKQALMQQLLTGQVRVNVADDRTEATAPALTNVAR